MEARTGTICAKQAEAGPSN